MLSYNFQSNVGKRNASALRYFCFQFLSLLIFKLCILFRAFVFATVGPVPGSPRNVSVEQADEGLIITWLAPLNNTVPIEKYVIEWKTIGHWTQLTQVPASTKRYIWKNHSHGVKYFFKIHAYTDMTHSPPSPIISHKVGGRQQNEYHF